VGLIVALKPGKDWLVIFKYLFKAETRPAENPEGGFWLGPAANS
jgi:hypothetical protein